MAARTRGSDLRVRRRILGPRRRPRGRAAGGKCSHRATRPAGGADLTHHGVRAALHRPDRRVLRRPPLRCGSPQGAPRRSRLRARFRVRNRNHDPVLLAHRIAACGGPGASTRTRVPAVQDPARRQHRPARPSQRPRADPAVLPDLGLPPGIRGVAAAAQRAGRPPAGTGGAPRGRSCAGLDDAHRPSRVRAASPHRFGFTTPTAASIREPWCCSTPGPTSP
jgi:hypothetical protein